MTVKADCYVREGDGGTKTTRFGSNTCFLNNFIIVLKRISARNLKNMLKVARMLCLLKNNVNKNVFKTNTVFLEGFALMRARAGPIGAYMGPYGPEKSKNIRNKFSLIRPLKGLSPCPK